LHDDNDFSCIDFSCFTEGLALQRRQGMIVWRLECGVFVLPVRWIEFDWASLSEEPVCVLL
jgi:hypothetical protein